MAEDKKPKVVALDHYRAMDAVPPELVEQLEHALQSAKDGRLVECILSYQVDTGTEINECGQFMWRNDGRLGEIHSECHVLAHHALKAMMDT